MNHTWGEWTLSESKKRFKTTIQGKTYVIVGTKSQAHMKTAAELVEEQLDQLKHLTVGLDGERRAILMAINAVSDQLVLKEKINELTKQKESLMQQLSHANDSENEEV